MHGQSICIWSVLERPGDRADTGGDEEVNLTALVQLLPAGLNLITYIKRNMYSVSVTDA
jgi:hypothetical protein